MIKNNYGFLNKKNIAEIANKYFLEYVHELGWKNLDDIQINIMELYESVIYPQHEINLVCDVDLGYHNKQKILGKTIPNDKIILIDKSISAPNSNDPRFVFTLGHEIGHGILHKQEKFLFRCTEYSIYNKENIREIEANIFATNLIMPAALLRYKFKMFYGTTNYRYVGTGEYMINYKKYHIETYSILLYILSEHLTKYFSNISRESLSYRLNEVGLVTNLKSNDFFARNSSTRIMSTHGRMEKISF